LRARFGFPRVAPTARTRLIFLKSEQRTVALIVDSAREFRSIPGDSIRPIEETLTGVNGNYVKGVATVADRLVLLLDVPAVLKLDSADAAPAAAVLQPSA
jgi:purine-binding chemotaxis protein CheW